MQFDAYYQLLARPDVKELALQTSRPPCVLIGTGYHPVANRAANEDEILALLAETGSAEMLGLMQGPRKWTFEHPLLGVIHVSAGYHGQRLQARLKRDAATLAKQSSRSAGVARTTGFSPGSSVAELTFATAQEGYAAEVDFGPPIERRGKNQREQTGRNEPPPSNLFSPPSAEGGRVARGTLARTRDEPPPGTARETLARTRGDEAPPHVRDVVPDDLFGPTDDTVPRDEPEFEAPRASAGHAAPRPDQRLTSLPGGLADLFRAARERDASDLHVLADRSPTLRIAGDLVSLGGALDPTTVEEMVLPIVPSRVRPDLDNDGACDFALQTKAYGRFRVNVTRQRTGYKLTARPIRSQVPTLAELGLPEAIASVTNHHQGLIVVTGPTGHGKTTTLAAIVDIINGHKAHHIITVEDPIEYVHPRKLSMMSQREVGTHTKKFATALKGSLREDPDVIVVGELRDTETVRMALSASETGHLVISTMNTPSAAKAIERLIDLFPPGDQPQVRLTLAGGLRLIISQRLVPNSDNTGMVAAAELLPGSPPLWALIRDGKTFQIPSLQQRGKALGIVRLDDSLGELVRNGKTTLETARLFAENPADFEAVVSGKNTRGGEELTIDSFDPTQAAATAAKEKAKDVLSRAGKFFGNEKK